MAAADEAVVRRFYDEMCNGRRLDIADEILAADHQYHDPNSPPARGPREMAEVVRVYQDGVEGHWDIHDVFSSGDQVAVRWTGRGRHTGDVNGIPPTGNPIEVDALSIHRVTDGKIAETWTVWDTLKFLHQIGAIPEMATA